MRTRWLLTVLLLAGLSGCGVEPAGTFPRPEAQPTAALVPVLHLQGQVIPPAEGAVRATIRVYDLATGHEVPLISAGGQNLISAGGQNLISAGGQNLISAGGQNLISAGGQNLISAGGQNLISAGGQNLISAGGQNLISAGGQNLISAGGQNLIVADEQGRFDILIPRIAFSDVLRVIARTETWTLANLVGAQGQVLGAAPAAPYRLQQQVADGAALFVELSPASTALAKTFAGALRLQLLLPPAEKQAAVEKVVRTANAAYTRVKSALADNPESANALVTALDERGEVQDVVQFQRALERLGVAAELGSQVNDIVAETPVLPVEPSKADSRGSAKPAVREDFPLGKVAIDADGKVSVPERERPVQKSATAEGAAPANNASAKNDTPASRSPGRTSSETPKGAASKGQNDAVSETPKDVAPKGSDGAASETPKDAAPKGSDGAASEKPKDAAPKGSDGAASEKPKDAAPKGSDGAASEKPKDTAPVNSNNDSQKDNKNKSDEPKGNKPTDQRS